MKYVKLARATLTAVALCVLPSLSAAGELPLAVKNALGAALQDEYHAEAFYAAVMARHGEIRPFSNIIQAERRHSAMLRQLMATYGVPSAENSLVGDEAIAAAVPASVRAACDLGVKAEIDNAALYNNKLIPAAAEFRDIVAVFKNLRDASQMRHLRAFERCGGR